jgi:hypothetical protein
MERKAVSCTDGPEPETDYYLKSLLIKKMSQIFEEMLASFFAQSKPLRVDDLGSNQKHKKYD